MSKIELNHIDKFYGNNHVLKDLNLVIDDGEFMTLLGPSGCGKTTTLRVVAGLEKPQNGTITMGDKLVVNAKELFFEEPGKRGLNLVFQSYALWPHMTVYNNIAFGLKIQKMDKAEIDRRVMDSLRMMRIDMYKDRYPTELSGGQQQRVAIARAISTHPPIIMADEPTGALDSRTGHEVLGFLQQLNKEGSTVILITHDNGIAATARRIVRIADGKIIEDHPQEVNWY